MRERTRTIAHVIISAMFAIVLCACSDPQSDNGAKDVLTVYDMSADMIQIIPEDYIPETGKATSMMVGELLQRLIDGPRGNRSASAIPEEVTKVTYRLGPETVIVDLGSSFTDIPKVRKVLCEAAIVRTLCQLDDIYAVSFSADGIPLCDPQGIPIGLLTPESFLENDGAAINVYERTRLHLFFADESGQKLVEKVENITYNSNIPMDRLIVDNIISGPKSTDAFATIAPSTVVISVTTMDGTCYVNLSKDFLNKTSNVSDDVMIYSIVNSLTQLTNINKVQLLVDGGTDPVLGDRNLSSPFERNLEIVN